MEHTVQKTSVSHGCNWFSKALFLNLLKRYFYIPIILFCTFTLSGPFVLYNTLNTMVLFYEDYTEKVRRFYDDLEQVLLILNNPILFMFVGVFVSYALFMFLFNQRTSYMMHAFPYQRKTIYCTTIVTAFLMILTPYLVTAAIVTGMASYGGELGVRACFISFGLGLCQMVFFLGLAIFVVMCTGQAVAVPILYVILNFLWVGMYVILTTIYDSFLFGASTDGFNSFFSPAFYLLENGAGVIFQRDYETGIFSLRVNIAEYTICLFFVGIILFLMAYVIYKKKQIESVGSLLPMRWTRPVFRWGVAICVSSILGLFVAEVIGYSVANRIIPLIVYVICFIIFGFMVFFGTAMLVAKSFKVFKIKLFGEYMLMLLACFVFLVASYTDAFGVEKRVPNIKDIQAVDVGFEGGWVVFDTENYYDMVQNLTQAHRDIVSDRKLLAERVERPYLITNMTEQNLVNTYFNISYSLKNGRHFSRYYSLAYIPGEDTMIDLALEQVEDTMNSRAALGKRLLYNYDTNKEWWPYRVFVNRQDYDLKYPETVDEDYFVNDYPSTYKQWSTSDKDVCEKVFEAFIKDVYAGNVGKVSLLDGEEEVVYSLEINFTTEEAKVYNGNDIYCGITEDAVNTIRALKECGVDF